MITEHKKRMRLLSLVVCVAFAALTGCSARKPLTVAAVACQSRVRDTEFNLGRIEHWARQAAGKGAELALFPECGIHCWWQNRDNRKFAEPIDGPSIQRLTRLAAELNIVLAVGMTELDGDKAYITQVLIDRTGVIGRH